MFLKNLRITMLTVLLALAAGTLNAQLFTRTFTAASGCPTGDNNVITVTGASLSSVGRGTGVSCNATANVFNSSFTATGGTIDLNKYIDFTVTAASGYDVTLTSVNYGRQRSGTGPTNSRVAHNFSGNYTTDFLDDATVPTSIAALSWDFTDFTITSGNSVSFRIYGWNNTGGTLRIDDLNIFGSVAASAGNSATVTVSPSSGSEAAQTSVTITVTTASNVAVNSTVNYAISGTGITSADFVGSPSLTGTITVLAGSNTGTASVQIFDDAAGEGTENATVTISSPTGSITAASGSASFSITDNDVKYYWNGGNIAALPANGGTGTWSAANSWRQPDANGAQATWVDNQDAVVAGAAGVLSITDATTVAPTSANFKTTGYTITSTGGSTTVINGNVILDAGVNLTINDATATANRTLSVNNISGGAGASLTLAGAQTGSNNSRLNIAQAGGVISVPVVINNTGGASALAGIVGTAGNTLLSGSLTNNSANVKTMLGATSGNSITVSGQIGGSQSVQFSAGTSGGAGTITLTNTNNYSGSSLLNLATAGTVKLGVTNALPQTPVTFGPTSGSGGNLDLNGFDVSIGALSSGSGAVGTITNSATGVGSNALTVTQSTTTTFALAINDGSTRKIALTKSGSGTLKLSASNTFSGGLSLNGGYIELGNGNIISNSCDLTFNGGGLSTGTTTGFNETVGTTKLLNNSSISLGSGAHQLNFANSSANTWTAGKTLTINGWVGVAGTSGTNGKVFFGTDNTGLTAAQLAQITFTGYNPGAAILGTGEVVPASASLVVDQTGFVSNFGNVNLGSSSAEQSFTVSGSSLSPTVSITPPAGFEISLTSGSGFQTTPITLPTTGGNLAVTTIYVRFTPVAAGVASGNIAVTSGSITQNVAVNGNGVVSAYYSRGTGYAAIDAIWSYSPTGPAQTIASLGGFSSSIDVVIQNGNTVRLLNSQEITSKNLTIESGGSLIGDPAATANFTPFYINVFGDIVADGQLGQVGSPDSLGLNIEGTSCYISGNGNIDVQRIRKSANTNALTNLTISRDVNTYWSATAVYNNVSATFNVVVASGATLNMVNNGDLSIDGTDGLGSGNRYGLVTINGTLNTDTVYARTDNNTSIPTGITVGASGTLNANTVYAKLTGNTFAFTVSAGGALNVYKRLQLVAGNFAPAGVVTLKSTASNQSAYLDNFSSGFTGAYVGSINVERFVPVLGSNQHFISSPVNNAGFSQVGATGPDGLYIIPTGNCDETQSANNSPYGSSFEYVDGHVAPGACMLGNWKIRSAGNLDNGRGYSTYLPGNTVTTFSGAPNTGNLSVSANNSGYPTVNTFQGQPVESGWNLVGNPYPSAIQLTTSRIADGFANQVQLWVTSGPFAGSWQPGVMGAGAGSAVVAPGQAFMVRRVGVGSGNFPFYQTERIANDAVPFYMQQNENTLSLELESGMLKDVTTIGFNADATIDFDYAFDANKKGGVSGRPVLYSQMGTNTWYSVNTLPGLTQVTTVPVGLRPGNGGSMTISAQGLQSFDPTAYIMLEDKKAGIMHNLRSGAYTFVANASDAQDRFVLHFTPGVAIAKTDAGCSNANGVIEFINPALATWNYEISVNGSSIAAGSLGQSAQIGNLASGVYNITLTDAANYVVVKNLMINAAPLPDAAFNTSVATAVTGEEVVFNASIEAGNTYSWDFGDGSSSNVVNATHTYTAAGVYNVALVVSNAEGCSANSSKVVTVNSEAATGINGTTKDAVKMWSNGSVLFVDLKGKTAFVQVYNILGEEVLSSTVSGNWQHSFSNFAAQCLLVKLTVDGEVIVKKVVMN